MVDIPREAATQASVIGAMLIDEKTIGPTLAEVRPEDFLGDGYRRIYEAIRKMFSDHRPVDPVTVLGELSGDGSADWYSLLKGCLAQTPTSANYREYIDLLRQEARLSNLQGLGIALMSCRDMDSAQACVAQINAGMVARAGMKTTTMEQGLADFFNRHRTKSTYIPWGIPELDEKLYVSNGKFVILAGYPSDGKTAMALSSAWTQSETARVGFYSLESDDGTLMDRIVARLATISMGRIKRSELDEEDYSAVAELSSSIISHTLEIVLASGATVDDIFSDALAKQYSIIYIDYIQLIHGERRFGQTEEIARISIDIHTKAQSTGINVIGLSQFSRPDKSGKERKSPTMSDLRGSGQLEQDADVIMLLYREEPERLNSRRVLKIVKNKEGEIGQMYLCFDGATQRFRKSAVDAPAPVKRAEPSYTQVQFHELSAREPIPFDA